MSGRTHLSRRELLRIGCLASLTLAGTALLAACGGSAGGPSTAATPPAAAPTTASAPAVASPTASSNAAAVTPTTAAATSATGATPTPAAAANATSAAGGKLTFTSSTLGNMQKMYPPILDKFRAANPGVQVEDVYAAASVPDYQTKLLLMLSSGNPPDIYWVHSYMTGGLNALNVPQDVTTYIKGDSSFNLDNYFASAVKEFQAGGKQNALPRETTSTILLYNKAIFQQAGVDLPKDGWKWADHDATAAKLTSGQGPAKVYGSAGWIQVAYIYYSLIRVWQEGGDVVDSDRAKYTLDQDPGVKVYTWIADMVAKGVHPASAQGTAGDPSQLFNTGKVAMIPSFSSFSFFDNAKFEWDIQHLPTDGKRVTRNASAGHAMTAVSKAKDNAWKLLSFLEGPTAMQDYFAAGLTVTYKTVAEQALKQRQGKPPANLPIVFDALGYARPEPVVGDWLGIHKTISTALEGVYGPEHKPVKDTLSGVADKVNPLIQSKPTAG